MADGETLWAAFGEGGVLLAVWPKCIEHGRLVFRVNEPGNSYYECMGFDGEGCDSMVRLDLWEQILHRMIELPPGVGIIISAGEEDA